MRNSIAIIFLILIASCVSNKKIQYLQKDDVNPEKGQILTDSTLRSYQIDLFEYRIQPHDVLSVEVSSLTKEEYDIFANTNRKEVNTGAFANNAGALFGELVDEAGNISFPVIGKIQVAGLTIFEIQNKIGDIAEKYLEDPVVKVRMLNFRFTVLGEVLTEGNITTYNNRTTIFEAIGLAGGLTDLGDRSSIKLVRQYGDKIDVQYLNILDENFINSPYYYMHQNDIIVIPPIKQRPFRTYFSENFGYLISSLTLLVLILTL